MEFFALLSLPKKASLAGRQAPKNLSSICCIEPSVVNGGKFAPPVINFVA
jgi:hypothetical protein